MNKYFLILFFALQCMPAEAVDYRWNYDSHRGVDVASIKNKTGSVLEIQCPPDWIEWAKLSLSMDVDKLKVSEKGAVDIQIIVSGNSFPFVLYKGETESDRRTRNGIYNLVEAITRSKENSFTVEFPRLNAKEYFSLIGAKELFKSADTFLKQCF